MQVIKRNGDKQTLDINHIRKQTIPACEGLAGTSYEELELGASIFFTEDIKTEQIQESLIRSAESKISLESPNWMYVAGRLRLYDLYHRLKHYYGITGDNKNGNVYEKVSLYTVLTKHSDIYSEHLTNKYTKEMIDELNKEIKSERDKLFTTAAVQTLTNRYLGVVGENIIELPQHMLMLISMFVASAEETEEDRVKWAKIFYEELSSLRMIAATPINSNGRFRRGSTASCFLTSIDDNLDSIFDTYKDVGKGSAAGGGWGIDVTRLRSLGSTIRNRDNSGCGVVPFTKILNDIALAVDQGGTRAGAFAIYLENWHIDFPDFLDMCKKHGDERRRGQDLFYAASISDLFITRIKESGKWTLFDPKDVPMLSETYGEEFERIYLQAEYEFENKVRRFNPNTRQLPAKEIFAKMIANWSTEGKLFWFFKDTVNKKHEHKELGIIRSSNLCVTGDTNILTKEYGYVPIAMLVESGIEYAHCWNGEEWSWTNLFKTSEGQHVVTVNLSNGQSIKATDYHKWYVVKDNYKGVKEKRTYELKVGDKLERFDLGIVDHGTDILPHAYTNGLFSAEGTMTGVSTGIIHLYNDKIKLLPYISGYTTVTNPSLTNDGRCIRQTVHFRNSTLYPKFFVPKSNFRLQDRIEWLAGLFDGDGTLTYNQGAQSIQITSTNKSFLSEVMYLLQEIGISSNISQVSEDSEPHYRLIIAGKGLNRLLDLGYNAKRVMPTRHDYNRDCTEFVRVISIVDTGLSLPTYCGNEPKRHKLMFNSQLTGNCVEVVMPTDENRTAVCNLGSLNLGVLNTIEDMDNTARILTRFLDNIIDVTIYHSKRAEDTQKAYRSIGIGVIGEAEYVATRHIEFASDEHKKLCDDIYRTISEAITDESSNLAAEKGGTKLEPKLRNLYRMAIAPNTSSGLLAGSTCSCEPVFAREWSENSKLGTYKMVAPHIALDNINYYKNAYEIDQSRLLELTAIRQKYIDMSISHSVYIDPNNYQNEDRPVTAKDIARLILKAHELGIKTLYYFRSKAKKNDKLDIAEKPKISCVGCEN